MISLDLVLKFIIYKQKDGNDMMKMIDLMEQIKKDQKFILEKNHLLD